MAIAGECLSKTLGRLNPVDFLAMLPHSSAPCVNLHFDTTNQIDNDDHLQWATEIFKKRLQSTYLLPITQPSRLTKKAINGVDPCLTLVKEKHKWEQHRLKILNKCDPSMIPNENNLDESFNPELTVPKNVGLLAQHIHNDPDPHFNSKYNWYYTGGTINTFKHGGVRYLIRPNNCTRRQNNVVFSELDLKQPTSSIFNSHEYTYDTEDKSEIFQIETGESFTIVRQRKRCTILIPDEGVESFQIRSKFHADADADGPFISCAINNYKDGQFCTLGNEREITVRNLNSSGQLGTQSLICEGVNSIDAWGQVYYIDRDTIGYVDRNTFYLLDLRTHMYGRGTRKWNIDAVTDICDEIFSSIQGPSGLQYVTTSHHLLGLDIRKGWIQRWTHTISQSPFLMSTVIKPNSGEDVVLLGSQRTDNVVYIENKKSEEDTFFSKTYPYALHSLCDTLHIARCERLCLNHILNSRFSMSQIGLCCYIDGSEINILRSTSVGDVFWQKMVDVEHETYEDKLDSLGIEILENWEKECVKSFENSKYTNEATKFPRSTHLFDNLKDFSEKPIDEKPATDIKPSGPWEKSKRQLKTYCDYLAPKLLEAWNISDDEEWCDKEELEVDERLSSSDDENDVTDRVSTWIENYCTEAEQNDEYPTDIEVPTPKNNKNTLAEAVPKTEQDNAEGPTKFFPDNKSIDRLSPDIIPSSQEPVSGGLFDDWVKPTVPISNDLGNVKLKLTPRKKYVSGF